MENEITFKKVTVLNPDGTETDITNEPEKWFPEPPQNMENKQPKELDEEWKAVKNYENEYMVSSKGRIYSLNGKKSRILTPIASSQGYHRVKLQKNKVVKECSVHRIVAEAFIQNPENKPTINHKNGVKSDNKVENLEWATVAENTIHRIKYLDSSKNTRSRPVFKMDEHGNIINEYNNVAAAARDNNVSITALHKAARGITKSSAGFYWKFKTVETSTPTKSSNTMVEKILDELINPKGVAYFQLVAYMKEKAAELKQIIQKTN